MSRTTIITSEVNSKLYLRDLWCARDLFYFFALRDILVRYKQAVFGCAWAIVKPLLTVAVFVLIFSKVAGFSSGNVNYASFVLLPMLFWLLFSGTLIDSSGSLIVNGPLITKIYFPRMVLPLSSIIIHLADFCVGLAAFLLLAFFTTDVSLMSTVWLIPFLILCVLLCIGTGLWLAALTARYRDFRFIVPFTVQFGLFVSPVGYSASKIPEEMLWAYCLNPLVGIMEGIRWAIFGSEFTFLPQALGLSVFVTALLVITGYFYFRSIEHDLADII
jgi:lipopolysaccharide transport system permease protein